MSSASSWYRVDRGVRVTLQADCHKEADLYHYLLAIKRSACYGVPTSHSSHNLHGAMAVPISPLGHLTKQQLFRDEEGNSVRTPFTSLRMETPMKVSLRVLFITALVLGLSSAAPSTRAQTDEGMPVEPNLEFPEEATEGMQMPPDEGMELPPDEMMPDDMMPAAR